MLFELSSCSIRFRNECAAISASQLVPHPTCTFPKNFCRSESALLPFSAFHLASTIPAQRVAYGNRSHPSVYLYEGDKLCAKKERS